MSKLIRNLLSLCVGIFLYQYFAGQNYDEAIHHSFWAVFGGIFVWSSK